MSVQRRREFVDLPPIQEHPQTGIDVFGKARAAAKDDRAGVGCGVFGKMQHAVDVAQQFVGKPVIQKAAERSRPFGKADQLHAVAFERERIDGQGRPMKDFRLDPMGDVIAEVFTLLPMSILSFHSGDKGTPTYRVFDVWIDKLNRFQPITIIRPSGIAPPLPGVVGR